MISIEEVEVIGETVPFIKCDICLEKSVKKVRDLEWVQDCIGIGSELDEWFSADLWSPSEAALALALVYEKRQAERSKWHAYISTIPDNLDQEEAVREFRSMQRRFMYHIGDLTWEEYFWAITQVQNRKMAGFSTARAFVESNIKQYFPIKVQNAHLLLQYSRFSEALVPILDMANHSDDPTCKYKPFKFVAIRDIQEGDEITWNYDPEAHPDDLREQFGVSRMSGSLNTGHRKDLRNLLKVDFSKNEP